jgi:hypothetical protein
MSKGYLFAVMLLAASLTGCIEGGDLEKSVTTDEEEETLKPVGVDNATNQPPLVTAGIVDGSWINHGKNFVYIDETSLIGDMYLYVHWTTVDVDGTIATAGFDTDLDMQIDVGVGSDSGIIIDSTMNSDHFPGALSVPLNQGWNFERQELSEDGDLYCSLVMHRTFAFVAVDDDGASSAQLIHYVYPDQFDDIDDYTIELLGIPDDDVDWVTGETSDCPKLYIPPVMGPPTMNFSVQESSSGIYYVDVIQVSEPRPLEDYRFYLQDTTGSTYVGGNGFGEIAMQMINGNEYGIDASYDGTDTQLQSRSDNVSADDGSNFPVHFNDNDSDGMLSAGDQFMVYGIGNSANGPASDNWRLVIQDNSTGDLVGSAVML